eukprot:6053847-Alexandrium_andersonii.AAC.1
MVRDAPVAGCADQRTRPWLAFWAWTFVMYSSTDRSVIGCTPPSLKRACMASSSVELPGATQSVENSLLLGAAMEALKACWPSWS